MRSLVVIALLVARTAAAGECSVEAMADAQDARANHPKASEDDFHLCLWWDNSGFTDQEPKLAKRLRASCEKILTARPNDDLCTNIAALLGLDQLGKTDVIAAIGTRKLELTDPHSIDFLAATRSPRAAPIVIEAWKKNQAFVAAHPRAHDLADDWANWRGAACRALAATGDLTARDFLAGQLDAKLDRGVKRAATRAIQMIEKRITSAR